MTCGKRIEAPRKAAGDPGGTDSVPYRLWHQLVDIRNRNRRHNERHVDDGLPLHDLDSQVGRVDEGLQQVDRRDADDRGGELDLEHVGIDVRQPLGFVGVAFEVEPRHEGFIAADDDHDQQVGDHDDVDQAQRNEHDGFFGQGEGTEDEVLQFDHEMHDVDQLRTDQAQIQRDLQPAAAEQDGGKKFAARLDGLIGFRFHRTDLWWEESKK